MVKNELNDSRMMEETADEDAGRRIAATWFSSKDADWWMAVTTALASLASTAPMATIASTATMASMVSMASMVAGAAMASMVAVAGSLSRKTVLSASEVLAETRRDTKTMRSLLSLCWGAGTSRSAVGSP